MKSIKFGEASLQFGEQVQNQFNFIKLGEILLKYENFIKD